MKKESTMKKLLLVLVFACAAPAFAIDYQKCEAINQAASRVRATYSDDSFDYQDKLLVSKKEDEKCEPITVELMMNFDRSLARTRCQIDVLKEVHIDRDSRRIAFDAEKQKILDKINKDYVKAGCY